jgi:hypothetical protein
MNYEELLESRNGTAMAKEALPFGLLYKKTVDNKYVNTIDLREELKDSLVFCDALTSECERNAQLAHKNQLHFKLLSDSTGIYGVQVEQGSYRTFERLLEDNPAVIAGKDFITNVIKDLLDITSYLHDQGIFHICYAPSNVLVRKGDNAPMLLFHGSAYQSYSDQEELYGDKALSFVAPEVIENGTYDARADIYSIGSFMEYLYRQAEIPFELKGVIKKATSLDPEKRYQTPEDMMKAMTTRQNTRKSLVSLLIALAVTGLFLGVYFSMTPEPENIEFVKPASNLDSDSLDGDNIDPTAVLGYTGDSTADQVDEKKMREYQSKAEQIFRKNYTRAATKILSRIYNNDRMNTTEKNFLSGSQSTMEELVKMQVQMGGEAGLSESRSQLIAGQIIEQVSNNLKAQMRAKEKEKEEESEIKQPKEQQE